MTISPRVVPFLVLSSLLAVMGCSGRLATQVTAAHAALSGITGAVHGGQQPVAGATVQLYAVGTTGTATAATPLMASAVTTDANGGFTLGAYSCSQATDVYLLATGGDPGLGSANPQIAMMTALGQCASLSAVPFISVNEVSTVSAVATLAPYMTSTINVGSAASDAAALDAAFATAGQMVDVGSGVARTSTGAGLTVPQSLIHTLGNVMSTCINSAGGVAGDGSACGTLFNLTSLPQHGAAPTDAVVSMLNTQRYPGTNVNALYNLAPAVGPFQPSLSAAPADLKVQPTGTLTLTPAGLDFGKLAYFNSASKTFTLTNSSASAVTLSNAALSGASEYVLTNNCGGSVAANVSCTYSVKFTPDGVSAYSTKLTVANNSATPTLTSSVTGQGQGSIALSASGSTTFSSAVLGATTTSTLTLTNMSFSSIALSYYFTGPNAGDFKIGSGSTCSGSLAARATCQLVLSFTPQGTGSRTASLDIYDSTDNQDQAFSLTGTGTANALITSPTSLTFYTYNVYQDLTVTNSNGVAIPVSGISVTGNYTQTNTCGASIPAAGTCTISVYLKGSSDGTLTLTSGAGTQTVSLTGSTEVSYIVSAPAFPASVAVGSSTSSTVTAQAQGLDSHFNGSVQYTLTGANAADFSFPSGSTCSTSSGGQCSVSIAFTPQATGTRSARLMVTTGTTSGRQGAGQYITLTGVGK